LKRSLTRALTLCALLLVCLPLQAQTEGPAPQPSSPGPYRLGERLTYNVSFAQFVSAGHIEFFVAQRGTFFNREAIVIRSRVETTGSVNAALYALDDDYTSYVDPVSGLPFRVQHAVRVGTQTSNTFNDYNQEMGTGASSEPPRNGEFPGTYDLFSALYRARALPLADGDHYSFTVQDESDAYKAELKVVDHDVIKTSVGTFNTKVARLNLKGGLFRGRQIYIYFSDDERHVPVLMTLRSSVGEIRAELAGSQIVPVAAPPGTPRPTPVPTPRITKPPVAPPSVNGALAPDLPFKIGEQLNFQVYITSVTQPVGTVSYQVRSRATYFNKDGLMLTLRAQTTNAAQRIFFANDQINSYINPVTLIPFRSEVNLVEGKRRFNRVWTIDQERGTAVGDNGERVEIPVGTYDLVSLLYAVRSLDLTPPRSNAVSLLVNNRPKTITITSIKREVIELSGQKIPAIQVSLTTDDAQADKFQIRAWLSADATRLPLRLAAVTPLGPLRADLIIVPNIRQ